MVLRSRSFAQANLTRGSLQSKKNLQTFPVVVTKRGKLLIPNFNCLALYILSLFVSLLRSISIDFWLMARKTSTFPTWSMTSLPENLNIVRRNNETKLNHPHLLIDYDYNTSFKKKTGWQIGYLTGKREK